MRNLLLLICLFFIYSGMFAQSNRGHTTSLHLESNITGRTYDVWVYTPSDYDVNTAQRYPTVYFQDGSGYLVYVRAESMLDTLFLKDYTSGIIGVFVNPANRETEYLFDDKSIFAEFYAKELVPFIDSSFRTLPQPENRMIIGASYGGNVSAYISYKFADVFGKCGLQSAAFRPTYDVFRLIVHGVKKQIRYYATWGTNERPIHQDMRLFRDSLIVKGYEFKWEESNTTHTWSAWQATLPRILQHFFPPQASGINLSLKSQNFQLSQNYPNPFNPSTTIKFNIPLNARSKWVTLKVFDVLGREIKTLVNEAKAPGTYEIRFDGSGFSSGIYLYTLTTGDFSQTRKLVLLK